MIPVAHAEPAPSEVQTRSIAVLLALAVCIAPALAAQRAGPNYVEFGIELFQRLGDARPAENHFISPLSTALAVAMAYDGADGETRRQIARALRLAPSDTGDLAARDRALRASLAHQAGVELRIANSLWVQRGRHILPAYAARLRRDYDAVAATLDLTSPGGMQRVNAWVRAHSGGRISRIMDEPADNTVVAMLLNAVYFNGSWLDGFDRTATREMPFTRGDGSIVQRPFMVRVGDYAYAREPGVQLARLPYRGRRFAMYVILPDSGRPLAEARAALSDSLLAAWIAEMHTRELDVELPKFRLEYDVTLNTALQALGMRDAFDDTLADFSRAFLVRPPGVPVHISRVRHKTFVDVSERGTEAAAVTSIEMVGPTAVHLPPPAFIVDRPFLLLIRDERTGGLLFIGQITDPPRRPGE